MYSLLNIYLSFHSSSQPSTLQNIPPLATGTSVTGGVGVEVEVEVEGAGRTAGRGESKAKVTAGPGGKAMVTGLLGNREEEEAGGEEGSEGASGMDVTMGGEGEEVDGEEEERREEGEEGRCGMQKEDGSNELPSMFTYKALEPCTGYILKFSNSTICSGYMQLNYVCSVEIFLP